MVTSTRERILEAAVELFASRGVKGTTIAAIEESAGLSPGAGGLFRHFRTKQALLEAALEPVAASVDQLESVRALLPLADLRSELTLLARGGLAGIASSRHLLRIIERDPEVVGEMRERAWREVIVRGYSVAARLIGDLAAAHHISKPSDPDALARIAIGSLANHLREREIYGDDNGVNLELRLTEAWVDVFHAYLSSLPKSSGHTRKRSLGSASKGRT